MREWVEVWEWLGVRGVAGGEGVGGGVGSGCLLVYYVQTLHRDQ